MSYGPSGLSGGFTEGNGKIPTYFSHVFRKTGSAPSCVVWSWP